jgi:hypothetical protein
MSTLKKTPGAQWILSAVFQYDVAGSKTDGLTTTDAMLNISNPQVLTNFKAVTASTPTFDVIPLPVGAEVISGEVNVLVVSNDTGAATIAVGDSASASRYLAATSTKALGRTALIPTGYVGLGEAIRITLVNTNGDATTAKVQVRVDFTISGRVNENLKTV